MTDTQRPGVLQIRPGCVDPALVRCAATALREGRLVAFPTETVYGLGCDAFNETAISRVFIAKGRPATDPLIVHVDGLAMLDAVIAGPLPSAAHALADAFWPGPLTIVLPRNARLPSIVTGGLSTVAVRAPSHPVASAIVRECGFPIAAPSANRFSHISPTSAQHVLADLGYRCDIVVDSGRTERGLESTVITFVGADAVVLRHGVVTLEELRKSSPVPVLERRDSAHLSTAPGHEKRHYSPGAPTLALAAGTLHTTRPLCLDSLSADGVVYVGYSDRHPQLPDGWRFEALGCLSSLEGVAHDLYDTLRRIDATPVSGIVVELTGVAGLGRAIDDRLTRAASSLVVSTVSDLDDAVKTFLSTGRVE